MLFEGVMLSVAGLVVFSIAILRSEDMGSALFGRRTWGRISIAAAVTVAGIAHFRPVDFQRGLSTAVEVASRELQKPIEAAMKAAFPVTTTTSTSAPAPVGRPTPTRP